MTRDQFEMARPVRIHKWLTLGIQAALSVGLMWALLEGRWLAAATTTAIIVITLLPLVLGKRFAVTIPPEFELLAVVFIYGSLFLGEVQGYYLRFWWWDAVLHAGSGVLLGILGFLLVHTMNELESVELQLRPRFVALFAFTFSIGMGALWEIFEFSMDQLFNLNMQKSGLIDTMWDLIVDTAGALFISLVGWSYLSKAGTNSFLERWIAKFIEANPRLFRSKSRN